MRPTLPFNAVPIGKAGYISRAQCLMPIERAIVVEGGNEVKKGGTNRPKEGILYHSIYLPFSICFLNNLVSPRINLFVVI